VRAELWGPDHVELEEVAVAGAGPAAAVALTRGRYPKTYEYTDANEDAVAVVVGPRATLLVCADGHNGATAPVRAVRAVLAELADDPPARLSDKEWLALFGRVNESVMSATGPGSQQPFSRTVLIVALVSAGEVSWASAGDAALVVAAPGAQRGRQLNREAMRFVGYSMSSKALKDAISRGRDKIAPGEWVVLVTDGLSEFIAPMRPADVVPRVLARLEARTPEAAARALVDVAGEAGAGDNVGVALLAPS
jgi:serine/threonine protein phosphatase PrpC